MSAEERATGTAGDAGAEVAPEGDAIIGATLEGLRRAAEEVEHVAAVAETLQRSLLPERLPELPGLEVSARYVAGSADAQVGGDWYDVIALRDGHAGVAIGDVVGHGLDAAARMARLQNALRAYALEGLRPSLVLERMNGFAREVSGGPMATLLYGVVDPDEGRLRLATAGHPPVLVIGPAGEAYFAEGPAGSPLGVVPFPSYEESTIPLVPGSTVLLYTDGLVERPDASLDEGLEWLREFAGGVPAHPDELCGALLQARFRDAPPRDDVALLAVRLEPVSLERIELTLRAEPESLAQMRRALGRWLRATGATDAETYEIAGRLRRGLRERDRPRLSARRGVLRGGGPARGRRGRGAGPRLRHLAAAALGLPGPGPRADRGADGRGRHRPRPGGDHRPHAPRGRRRRGGTGLMRDRIAGFEFEQRDSVLIAAMEGEIDSSNAAELRLALSERLPSASSALVLDLSSVTYLDSSGIHLLFDLGRRLAARRQALRLVVPDGAPMRRVLELCAVDGVAPMDRELDASLKALAETEI